METPGYGTGFQTHGKQGRTSAKLGLLGLLIAGAVGQDLDKQTIGVAAASGFRRQTVLQGEGQRKVG